VIDVGLHDGDINACEEYLKEREKVLVPSSFVSKKTWFHRYILPYFAAFDVRELRGYHLHDFYTKLVENKKISLSSVKKLFVEFKAFLNWCLKREIIEKLPSFPEIKVPEPAIKWLSHEDQLKILQNIPDEHRPIFEFLFATGCRVGEARALMWDCVMKEGYIIIRRSFSGEYHLKECPKEGKQKVIPLTGWIKEIIERQAKNKKSIWVFPYKSGKRWIAYPYKRLNAIFKEACKKAGIKDITLYQASRHSFAMSRLQAGFSYEEVGAALGHSNPQTTRRYARLKAEQVKHVFEGSKIIPFPGNRKKSASENQE